ncbi:MAG: hypothetical protein ACK5ZH_07610 [Alphaproteobacteria bacterium]
MPRPLSPGLCDIADIGPGIPADADAVETGTAAGAEAGGEADAEGEIAFNPAPEDLAAERKSSSVLEDGGVFFIVPMLSEKSCVVCKHNAFIFDVFREIPSGFFLLLLSCRNTCLERGRRL